MEMSVPWAARVRPPPHHIAPPSGTASPPPAFPWGPLPRDAGRDAVCWQASAAQPMLQSDQDQSLHTAVASGGGKWGSWPGSDLGQPTKGCGSRPTAGFGS